MASSCAMSKSNNGPLITFSGVTKGFSEAVNLPEAIIRATIAPVKAVVLAMGIAPFLNKTAVGAHALDRMEGFGG